MNKKGEKIMNEREYMVMNKRAKTAQLGKLLIIFASLILCLGMGTTQALAAVDTTNNNFTMNQPDGVAFGGTNDVHFTWDGTTKTSVAAVDQVSNATISSSCPFFSYTWSAHDVAIYGPGTYTVYSGCPAGSPGCGTGASYTFTVYPGEIGGHMLFNWNNNNNIDVVDVWKTGSYDQGVDPLYYTPVPMWTGECGSNSGTTVWDLMSYDWDLDGVNGASMVDGPFSGMNANFNLMINCDDGNLCTADSFNFSTYACEYTSATCLLGGTCNVVTGNCPVCDDEATRCDDNNDCTENECNNDTGVCENTNNTKSCDDSIACTESDTCSGGVCAGTTLDCDDSNACTTDSCNASTGECVNTNNTNSCDDGDDCTAGDFCDDGVCVSGSCIDGCETNGGVDTTGNNFSMHDAKGILFGGTNDVRFIWDGTVKTSVAVSGQVSNASISSVTPFFGYTWATTDVAIYGPHDNGDGTYSEATYVVYTDCPPGSPGCGLGVSYTFKVGPGELGAHMLFKWGAEDSTTSCGQENCDIDVVDVWTPGKAFGPSEMHTDAGGSNPASRVWDWMSKDWDGDGQSGAAMVDGPFVGCKANFNVMGVPGACNNRPSEPELVYPAVGASGLGTTVEFRWKKSTDADDTVLTYILTYCTNTLDTATCTSSSPMALDSSIGTTAKTGSKGMFYAGGAGLLVFGLTFIGGSNSRRRMVLLLIMVVLFAGGTLMSCQNDTKTEEGKYLDINEMSYEARGLNSATTYYWKVEVSDGKSNGTTQSPRQGHWSFTTQ